MQTLVSFYLPNIGTDTIDAIGAGNYGGMTAAVIVANDPRFWIQQYGGDSFLCTVADLDKGGLTLQGNNLTLTVSAKAFVAVPDLTAPYVGGHPPYVPKPTK
jgi:hypothetical protein